MRVYNIVLMSEFRKEEGKVIERNFYKDRKTKLYHHNEEEIHLKSYIFGNGIRLLASLAGITCLALFFENSRMDNTSIVVLYVLAVCALTC